MPRKTAAKARKSSKKAAPPLIRPALSRMDVATYDVPAHDHQAGERKWLALASAEPGQDPWTDVEEHLLQRAREREHQLRRWKFYAK